ncbi:MAG: ATP-binding cassette domain-containing protein [Anaerolineae bacterium]|jgi:ABC-2 type transport system ATP-binding protein
MTRQQELAIETAGLVKRYDGDVLAVDGLDLEIASGTAYALLGPNGAGKTTTISVLTTLLEPTSGSAKVSGFDVLREADRVRERIGVTFQDIVLDPDLTGRQVLDIHGRLYRQSKRERQEKIQALTQLVELEEALDRAVKTYSGGMKRRLELARGLMTEPEILFLDEPTLGLDPQNRAAIWDYLHQLRDEAGLTVLLTTHYMEEAEELADRVGIIDHGRLVTEGSPAELIEEMGADVISVTGQGARGAFLDAVKSLDFVERIDESEDGIQIGVDNGSHRLAELVSVASQDGFAIKDISISKPSLGDVFLKYTGRQLRDH